MDTGATTDDPTHLNDVRVVGRVLAETSDRLNPGDVLVSLRSLNAVGILDADTRRFKWTSAGTTLRQHSPRFFGDGILVFDNLGGPQPTGGSRLVRIDLDTGVPETVFPRPSQSLPGRFFSETAGHLDLDEAGRRALVAITNAGVVWEIDLERGEVLWEYGYLDVEPHEPRPLIFTAKYVEAERFPFPEEDED
jgi:hypothetical protein